jgi:hypothetical protein
MRQASGSGILVRGRWWYILSLWPSLGACLMSSCKTLTCWLKCGVGAMTEWRAQHSISPCSKPMHAVCSMAETFIAEAMEAGFCRV